MIKNLKLNTLKQKKVIFKNLKTHYKLKINLAFFYKMVYKNVCSFILWKNILMRKILKEYFGIIFKDCDNCS